MFEHLTAAPPDPILGITDAFNRDSNPEKINLSVGVYQDANGKTPVLQSVKRAEQILLETEKTKNYLGIDGLATYREHVRRLLFGEEIPAERVAILQTPGGTGGVRLAAEFLAHASPHAKVWYSNPTWANHGAIFQAAKLETDVYPYLNATRTGLDFDALFETLSARARPGDAVLLHACCHNPTGIDPNAEQWHALAGLMHQKGLLPIVDFAYQGFGRGLDADRMGLQVLSRVCPELLVASSFSKNFGLYSERVGAMALVGATAESANVGMSQLKRIVRTLYSNPPRHGASIVSEILGNEELVELWRRELDEMRGRIAQMRREFVATMATLRPEYDFSFLLDQLGMFSYSGLTPLQVDRLKNEYSLYIVGTGRINVAGLTPGNLGKVCAAIGTVLD
jgi:aspartate/tyrosine/aromatic aminotransferase